MLSLSSLNPSPNNPESWRRSLLWSPTRPIFFPRIEDSHCDRIHFSLTAVRCFDSGYVGKQRVALKEDCAEYWLKELQESIDRCTGCCDITEILLKTVSNTVQSIYHVLVMQWPHMVRVWGKGIMITLYWNKIGRNVVIIIFYPLPDDRSLDWSKLKQIADNTLKRF